MIPASAFQRLVIVALLHLHSRLDAQEITMIDIKSDIDTLTTAETALETKVAADASEIAGLKAQIVPGVVLTDEQSAAIHALADRYAALAGLTTTAPADPAPVEATAPVTDAPSSDTNATSA